MLWLCVAAAADRVEGAAYHALVAGEAHVHALALVAPGRGGPRHLALLAVLDPVAILDGLTRPREVDLLSCRVAARQRRWRLAAYLLRPHGTCNVCDGLREEGQLGWLAAAGGCAWRRPRRT